MTQVFYTSDTHFDHKFVAGLRGFDTPEEHDAEIIGRWNSVVRPDDVVYHLGDVGMGHYARWGESLHKLNGVLHLVTGNHDDVFPGNRDSFRYQHQWMAVEGRFESVQAFARRKAGSFMFLLSHFPYDGDHSEDDRYVQYRLRDEGMWLLHGHTHLENQRVHGRQLHVGLDAWNLAPVSQDVVLKHMARADITSNELTDAQKADSVGMS